MPVPTFTTTPLDEEDEAAAAADDDATAAADVAHFVIDGVVIEHASESGVSEAPTVTGGLGQPLDRLRE